MSRIPIKGFLPNTLIDWEGKVAAEIFLSGCNFRCPFCHSGYLVYDRENECIPLESILACIEREKGWIDGVVISGGEPTLCPALEGLCVEFRNRNLGVKLDTNGSNPALIGRLVNLGLLDFVSLDVKAPLDERYSAATGVMEPPVEQVRESVRLLMRSSIDYEFRTTVVPTLHNEESLEEIGRLLAGGREWVLQQFNPKKCLEPEYEKIVPYELFFLKKIASNLSRYLPVRVRGEYD